MQTENKISNIVVKTQYQTVMELIDKPPYRYEKPSTGEVIPKKTSFPNEDRTVMIHHFPKCFVSDTLNSNTFFNNLTHRTSAFISSQTGGGKTTFILDTVLKHFEQQGKRILILSSRTLLSNKLKHDTIKKVAPELEKELTEIGISHRCEYGNVDIIGYQQIFNENVTSKYLETFKNNIATYGVVIFDEVHFFVSDASFNRYTEKIFKDITTLCFRHCVSRIYMTATPDAVFNVILKWERELNDNISFFRASLKTYLLNFYHFDRDYSYIDIHPFDYPSEPDGSIKATAKLIKNDINKQFKWIVFVNKTDFASKLKVELEKEKWQVCELNSSIIHNLGADNSEITKKTVDSLSKKELIPDDVNVLISTKCLDVGISIQNKNVRIINFLTDPSEFIQAIGRKRVTSKDDRVHLYLPKYTLKSLQNLYKAANGTLREMAKAIKFHPPGTTANCSYCDMPVYVCEGKFNYNEYSLVNIQSRLDFFDSIIDACSKGIYGDETDIILSYFYSLLGLECRLKHSKLTSNDQADSATIHSELLDIAEKYAQTPFSEDKLDELFKELAKFSTSKTRPDRSQIGIIKANKILSKIGYKIKKCQEKSHKVLYELYQI